MAFLSVPPSDDGADGVARTCNRKLAINAPNRRRRTESFATQWGYNVSNIWVPTVLECPTLSPVAHIALTTKQKLLPCTQKAQKIQRAQWR
ncbi:hypothetical protein PoB_004613100 [Plakobranchus ocellatus]|uniref:Uncharacterized protein n=1 Tax=Plakobranchus ocellatus TaxID=259542 RepID=A0AAV4BGR4_9GAST|nr:hypothetical protein PoB_004613100 [Plakobranchus ocellatus]